MKRFIVGAACLALVGGLAVAGSASARGHGGVVFGEFVPYEGGDPALDGIEGWAAVARKGHSTAGWIVLSGLEPDTLYGAHLHDGACAERLGHYKHDPDGWTTPPNELWFNGLSDGEGNLNVSAVATWRARPEARSIVIHAPGGDRVSCADLGRRGR